MKKNRERICKWRWRSMKLCDLLKIDIIISIIFEFQFLHWVFCSFFSCISRRRDTIWKRNSNNFEWNFCFWNEILNVILQFVNFEKTTFSSSIHFCTIRWINYWWIFHVMFNCKIFAQIERFLNREFLQQTFLITNFWKNFCHNRIFRRMTKKI